MLLWECYNLLTDINTVEKEDEENIFFKGIETVFRYKEENTYMKYILSRIQTWVI